MADAPGASLERDVLPGKALELAAQLLLVALDDHDVVGTAVGEVVGVLALGVYRVAGDDGSGRQVGDGVQRLQARDLVGLLADVQLGQDEAGGVLQCGEQVDLAALRSGRAAQALAVNCEAAQPGRLRAAVGEPAPDIHVQCVAVDAGQQLADRGLGGRDPPGQKRIGSAPTCSSTYPGASAIHSPTASSEVAPASTAHAVRASTTARLWRTPRGSRGVRHLGQQLRQARDLLGADLRILAQLVKGRRNQR